MTSSKILNAHVPTVQQPRQCLALQLQIGPLESQNFEADLRTASLPRRPSAVKTLRRSSKGVSCFASFHVATGVRTCVNQRVVRIAGRWLASVTAITRGSFKEQLIRACEGGGQGGQMRLLIHRAAASSSDAGQLLPPPLRGPGGATLIPSQLYWTARNACYP